jgi:hypothetical protein
VSYAGRYSAVPAFVATAWQVPAVVEVSESELLIEHPAVPEALTAKETAPTLDPPDVERSKFVR